MRLIVKLFVNTLAIIITAYLLHQGVHIDSLFTAVVVAIALGVINLFVKPILTILTLPLTILTFGLFAFIINAVIILLVSWLVHGFHVDGFLWALAFSLVLSIISAFLNVFIKN